MARSESASSQIRESGRYKSTTLAEAEKTDFGKDCGADVGLRFQLFDGDIVKFDSKADMALYTSSKEWKGNTYEFLYVSAFVNGRAQRFPMWALRRRVFGTPEEVSKSAWMTLQRGEKFYAEILEAFNDVERALLVAGKKFKVRTQEIVYTTQDSTTPSTQIVWLFDVVR